MAYIELANQGFGNNVTPDRNHEPSIIISPGLHPWECDD